MYKINLDWLAATIDLNSGFKFFENQQFEIKPNFDFDADGQNYVIQEKPAENSENETIYNYVDAKGDTNFRYGKTVVDKDGRTLATLRYGNPLKPIGSIQFENSIFYNDYCAPFSVIINNICIDVNAKFSNWSRVDICRDGDQAERYAEKYDARDFMRYFMAGDLKRTYRFNASKSCGIKERKKIDTSTDTVKLIGSGSEPYQTLYFTARTCNCGARLYNKSIEMKSRNYKDYIFRGWQAAGLDTSADIFRFELELKNFAGHNSQLGINGEPLAKDINFFDDQKNYISLFYNLVAVRYCIRDSYYKRNLFEIPKLSNNLYYVGSQRVIEDILKTNAWTQGVLNWCDKLSSNVEFLSYLSDTDKMAVTQTTAILRKLHAARFQNLRDRVSAAPDCNTGAALTDNILKFNPIGAKIDSVKCRQYSQTKYYLTELNEVTGEYTVTAALNSLQANEIIRIGKL